MPLPYPLREAMFKPATSEGVIAITTINRPGWASPLRFTGHAGILSLAPFKQGVRHQGEDYTFAVCSLPRRPSDVPGTSSTLPVAFATTTEEELGELLTGESVNDLEVTQKHLALSDPETIVEVYPTMIVKSAAASHATKTVALMLSFDRRENEPANMIGFTPEQCGGLFP